MKQFTPRFLSVIFRCGVKHVFLNCINGSKLVCLKYQGKEKGTLLMYGEEMDYALEDYFDPVTGRFVDTYEDLSEYDVYGW